MKQDYTPLSPEEKKVLLIKNSREHLWETLADNMPAAGRCKPYYCWFDIPGTQNCGYVSVECHPGDANQRILLVMVRRAGSQYVTKHFHFTGTLTEIIAYLADPAHEEVLLKSLNELSDAVDESAGQYPMG